MGGLVSSAPGYLRSRFSLRAIFLAPSSRSAFAVSWNSGSAAISATVSGTKEPGDSTKTRRLDADCTAVHHEARGGTRPRSIVVHHKQNGHCLATTTSRLLHSDLLHLNRLPMIPVLPTAMPGSTLSTRHDPRATRRAMVEGWWCWERCSLFGRAVRFAPRTASDSSSPYRLIVIHHPIRLTRNVSQIS